MSKTNIVIISGNVGLEPEIKQLPNNKVAYFNIAQTYKYGDKETTTWHSIKAWDKSAEFVEKYVKKGQPVIITGRLTYESWEKEGQKHTKAVITASNIESTGGKRDDSSGHGSNNAYDQCDDLP